MIGDIVGAAGLDAFLATMPSLRIEHDPDFVIVNGENAASGRGIAPDQARRLYQAGVDVITLGNHAWHKSDVVGYIDREPRLLRPANYPEGTPGRGYGIYIASNGASVCVANLLGRAMMDPVDDPFRAGDAILADAKIRGAAICCFDFHAETTSEKQAFANYVDGRASVVAGTHTHVQTADNRVLARGTAFITDLGMTGPQDSILGMNSANVIARFMTHRPQRFEVAGGPCRLNGAVIEIDRQTGRAIKIDRIALSDIPVDSD